MQEAYKKRLAENLLSSENAKEAKILAFKTKVGGHTGWRQHGGREGGCSGRQLGRP